MRISPARSSGRNRGSSAARAGLCGVDLRERLDRGAAPPRDRVRSPALGPDRLPRCSEAASGFRLTRARSRRTTGTGTIRARVTIAHAQAQAQAHARDRRSRLGDGCLQEPPFGGLDQTSPAGLPCIVAYDPVRAPALAHAPARWCPCRLPRPPSSSRSTPPDGDAILAGGFAPGSPRCARAPHGSATRGSPQTGKGIPLPRTPSH